MLPDKFFIKFGDTNVYYLTVLLDLMLLNKVSIKFLSPALRKYSTNSLPQCLLLFYTFE